MRSRALRLFLVLASATLFCGHIQAQSRKVITVIMLDGKTGKPIIPSNFIVRINHLNAVRNDWVTVNDDGAGQLSIPVEANLLAVQGTYNNSMDIYVNCDAAMQKDVHTLHWYSIPDILAKGVNAPNECYKGKFAESTHLDLRPGVFVLYVRKSDWKEVPEDY